MAVYSARTAHQFCAARMRRKLVNESDTNILLGEAFEMVRREIGSFPSEDRPGNDPYPDDDSTERAMREIAAENFEALMETESYMWGLGIAGIFHLWERETRRVIQALNSTAAPEKLEKLDFKHCATRLSRPGSRSRSINPFQHYAWLA
jgi:hypothetical protein